MRVLAHVAALVGLLAFGLALGDLVADPGVTGALVVAGVLVVLVLALFQLYKPGGVASRNPAPAAPRPERARPRPQAPVGEAPKRRPKPKAGVWAEGWDAREADEARERRRADRARKRGRG